MHLEGSVKMIEVGKSAGTGDFGDGKAGCTDQQLFCLDDTRVKNVFLGRHGILRLEHPPEIPHADVYLGGDLIDGQFRVGIIAFHVGHSGGKQGIARFGCQHELTQHFIEKTHRSGVTKRLVVEAKVFDALIGLQIILGIGDFEYRKLPVVEGMIAIEVDERIVAPFFSVQQIRSAHWQQNRMVIVRQILPVFILIQDSAAVRPAKRQAVALPVCDRPLGSFGDRDGHYIE